MKVSLGSNMVRIRINKSRVGKTFVRSMITDHRKSSELSRMRA